MPNEELIRKLQSRISQQSNIIRKYSARYNTAYSNIIPSLEANQKLDKKLLAALYEVERVKKDYDVLWGY